MASMPALIGRSMKIDGLAARHQHGATQILLQHRADDEAEQERRGLAVQFAQQIAEGAEDDRQRDLERRRS